MAIQMSNMLFSTYGNFKTNKQYSRAVQVWSILKAASNIFFNVALLEMNTVIIQQFYQH